MEILKKQLYWLKREDCNVMENIDESEIPHEFLCPITHEIMKEPVQCSGKIIEKVFFYQKNIPRFLYNKLYAIIIFRWIYL